MIVLRPSRVERTLSKVLRVARELGLRGLGLALGVRLALIAAPDSQAQAQTQAPVAARFSEYQVKGAFLVKFAMFVDWPAATFAQPDTPITIGVLGEDPFGPDFEQELGQERINGRRLVLKRSRTPEDLRDAQILFVAGGEAGSLPAILDTLHGRPILTVSDQERFAHRGGMIHFVKEGRKIRFEINAMAVQSAGLKLSAKLMQVALPVVVQAGKEGR